MTIRYVDGNIHWDKVNILRLESKDGARRLASHLMTKGYEFAFEVYEGECLIYISIDVNLTRLQNNCSAKWVLE